MLENFASYSWSDWSFCGNSFLWSLLYISFLRLVGTPFYIMEHVPGRIFKDISLPSMSPPERTKIYSAMCEVLAKIHSVNISEAKLDDYGKKGESYRST